MGRWIAGSSEGRPLCGLCLYFLEPWFSNFSLICTSLKNALKCGPFAHLDQASGKLIRMAHSLKHPLQGGGGSIPSSREQRHVQNTGSSEDETKGCILRTPKGAGEHRTISLNSYFNSPDSYFFFLLRMNCTTMTSSLLRKSFLSNFSHK